MEELIQQIASKIKLSPELKASIKELFIEQKVPKKTQLLREFQYCQNLYFLSKGTVRTFYYHEDKIITSWFYNEGNFFSSWYSFYLQKPSFEYVEVVEDSTIYKISYDNYQLLLDRHSDFERFGRLLAEEYTAFIDQYSKGYMFLSAKERYQLLLTYFPDIELRVKLGDIASFLGITQETLSRIRSRK
ncbi:Crp/Fnr family transcriptional regulator [Aureispira anguillae]|uniref:Crp/Fnr family transcriptional regulator n=1 Tax=Aureispira anguillae TaxID=2864201 RepID=A0A915YL93_9BACT|nr:Crp/Fnr family transcriptional regulator [Aureispira anguillae]BDS15305.1 Crp/Fnr family transcriptional regulator [Aureispira anguillae]